MSGRYSRSLTCSECWEVSSSYFLSLDFYLLIGYRPIYLTTACCPVCTRSRHVPAIHQKFFLFKKTGLPSSKCSSVIYRFQNIEPDISTHTGNQLHTQMSNSMIKREEVKTRLSSCPISTYSDKSRDFDINHDKFESAEEFDGELIDKVFTEISNRRLYSYCTKDILYSAFWCFKCSKSK